MIVEAFKGMVAIVSVLAICWLLEAVSMAPLRPPGPLPAALR
jgi:hypothetical protein